MNNILPVFFDHSRHKLWVRGLDASLDVLAFHGEERLSGLSTYSIHFTSTERDLAADRLLGKDARFSLYTAPHKLPPMPWNTSEIKPLRTLHGVITSLQRLSGSVDEARYAITLQPRLARLDQGRQFRVYQHQSVPQIVESILRSRYDFRAQDFLFRLAREYPRREQVMQYGESDLAFISRLLAEAGIWYHFSSDEHLRIDVVEFCDDQRGYQFGVELPYRPSSGFSSNGQDAVWALQTRHQVLERPIDIHACQHRNANTHLDADVERSCGVPGDHCEQDEDPDSESAYFYARLRHERYLNDQTHLSGVSNSVTLAPGQVLDISGGAPQAFAHRAVITHLTTRAARDASFECSFEAIPYAQTLCFRPPLLAKPQIAGTVPARVVRGETSDRHAEIDLEGRYRVNVLFDRDHWPLDRESMWLRLARPYAGDAHGLHLPLIGGTEVAVAFEQGDPDRPYIAHTLHDSEPPGRRHAECNVLATPANKTGRMDNPRGQEHVRLSTEYGGRSQLNLGHLVNARMQRRGEGFELRSDDRGAIRGGKGLFITADGQPDAQGPVLDMNAAVDRLQQASEQLQTLSADAEIANADPADVSAQLNLLRQDLQQLKSSVLLLSAPQGIALTSGKHLQLAAQNNLMLNAGGQADISVVKRLFMGVGQGLSLFVRTLGIKLIANQGPVSVQARNDALEMIARHGLDITSTEDEIRITAKKKITLNAGGSSITLDECGIESGTVGDYNIKPAHVEHSGAASMQATHPDYAQSLSRQPLRFNVSQAPNAHLQGWAGMPYTLYADGALLERGVLDQTGQLRIDHQAVTRKYRLVMANGVTYQIPVPSDRCDLLA